MKFLVSLAWKNLFRYRKRTCITAAAIAAGLAIFIFVDSLLIGAERDSEINLVYYETGAAQVIHPEYLDEKEQRPLEYLVENPQSILEAFEKEGIPATPRIQTVAEIIVNEDPFPTDGSMDIQLVAFDPVDAEKVFRYKETLTGGTFLEPGDEGILVGSWLAEDLGAKVGYPIRLRARNRYNAFVIHYTEIKGIFTCPNPILNRTGIFMSLDAADYFLQTEGAVSEIVIGTPGFRNIDKKIETWNRQFAEISGKYKIASWKEIVPEFIALVSMKSSGSKIILFLVFLIAAVGISNTMLMAVYERMKELGMMQSLGMTRSQVFTVFLLEAAGIGFIGSLAGTALGCMFTYPIVKWGIDYSALNRNMDIGYRTLGIIRGLWIPESIIAAFVAGIVLAMLAAVIPVYRATKLQIHECLKEK